MQVKMQKAMQKNMTPNAGKLSRKKHVYYEGLRNIINISNSICNRIRNRNLFSIFHSFFTKKKDRETAYLRHFSVFFGGDDRDRTDYLLNAIQALSQVSYTPECLIIIASPPPACKRFFQNCSGLSKTLLLFHKQFCYLSALHKRGRGIAEGKTAVRNRKAKAEKPIRTGKSSQNPLKKPNYRRCFSAKMPIE